jgi:hypothetical protein
MAQEEDKSSAVTSGQDRPFNMRLSDRLIGEIDEWRRAEPDLPGRSEAIRRLLAQALTSRRATASDGSEP